ncbi:MAG: hypothetical protein Q8908_08285 [Bacteroidota bacterium]|nr:hypothetical protein [Bacteroidota bacterium]
MKRNLLTLFAALLIGSMTFAQVRPYDKTGLNVFETPKVDTLQYTGLKIKIGGAFTQSWQSLQDSHSYVPVNGVDPNKLVALAPGFNTANANLYFNVQLGDGILLNLTQYLSSRHHNETWVKGGFIQFDKLPFLHSAFVDNLMKYTTIKVGHMEINYGDAHFRRSDNGNSIYNPFIENNIMDEFATEIGMEVDVQHNGFLAVGGVTNGEIKGDELKATAYPGGSDGKHHPTFLGKIGFDKKLADNVRLRVTGSGYYTAGSVANTLFGGDRGGSHYFYVIEKASTTSEAFSGRFNPGFSDKIGALMGNIFLKAGGFEWFTTLETAKGRAKNETIERTANQAVTDAVYRFGSNENFWLGARYNYVKAGLLDATSKVYNVNLNRTAFSAGWFVTKNIMAKAEYVNQNYNDFLPTDIRNNAKFNGVVIEAVVGF